MRRKMLRGRCLDIVQASTADDLRRHLVAAAADLGFGRASATVVLDHAPNYTEFIGVNNAPADYVAFYDDRKGYATCPVSRHCKRFSTPIVWDRRDYVEHGVADSWEHQARFGYRTGIAMASHLSFGRHFFFGFDSDRPLPKNPRIVEQLIREMGMLMHHAQDVAFEILAPEARPARNGQPLNPFEKEALRWSMDGLSPSEVGERMNLAEDHVRFHLQNAILKLGCRTKHQAVLRCFREGLFS
jgi:DNA-binding CsgD family transcriptional regulator